MVFELLEHGANNARTGKELAEILDCDIRVVTRAVEIERRQGQPICANMRGDNSGYYLAQTPEELEIYCRKLYKRGGELFKTRRALLCVLTQLQKQREAEEGLQ